MLIHNFLTNSAKADENKIAVVHGQDRLNYGELDMLSNGFAADLSKQGVQKGDRVILFLNNSIEYLIAYFAIL